MQSEAGQTLSEIVVRKELERQACCSTFFWGVGNAPSRFVPSLIRQQVPVPIIFSVMRSPPKPKDVAPSHILVWRAYQDHDGWTRPLPEGALVTSRMKSGAYPRHYALICKSNQPLVLSDQGGFDSAAYRNLGIGEARIGASQVTALAQLVHEESSESPYRRNIVAQLTGSYWVRLLDPFVIERAELNGHTEAVSRGIPTLSAWRKIVQTIKMSGRRCCDQSELPLQPIAA